MEKKAKAEAKRLRRIKRKQGLDEPEARSLADASRESEEDETED